MKKTVTAFILIVCLLLSFGGCGKESKTYKQAEKLIESSEYAQAAELLISLGDYKDAADRALECKYKYAESCVDAKSPDISEAMRIFEELGDYSDAKAKLETLKKKYFYPDFDYRIPALECIFTGAQHTSSNEHNEENGAYHRYSYKWTFSDSYASASNLSEGFSEWISYINENADGLKAVKMSNGSYTIFLDSQKVGTAFLATAPGMAVAEVQVYEINADS